MACPVTVTAPCGGDHFDRALKTQFGGDRNTGQMGKSSVDETVVKSSLALALAVGDDEERVTACLLSSPGFFCTKATIFWRRHREGSDKVEGYVRERVLSV